LWRAWLDSQDLHIAIEGELRIDLAATRGGRIGSVKRFSAEFGK
jgi:hypothetical protein